MQIVDKLPSAEERKIELEAHKSGNASLLDAMIEQNSVSADLLSRAIEANNKRKRMLRGVEWLRATGSANAVKKSYSDDESATQISEGGPGYDLEVETNGKRYAIVLCGICKKISCPLTKAVELD